MADHTATRQPNYGVAAIGFFPAAACFFIAAALMRDLTPWFISIGAINIANGCLLSLRARRAAAAADHARQPTSPRGAAE